MLLAFSTGSAVLVLVAFVGCVIVAAVLSGNLFARSGDVTGERGGRGERIPDPPGFGKPPRDGGLL